MIDKITLLIDRTSVTTNAGDAPTTVSLIMTPEVGPDEVGLLVINEPPHCDVPIVFISKLQFQIVFAKIAEQFKKYRKRK